MTKRISLTRGKYTTVDNSNYEWLSQWKWFCSFNGYACRSSIDTNGKKRTIRMHRLILGTPKNMKTDHMNCNKLDNRRTNLRICTPQQNIFNKVKGTKKYTSKYKGVYWCNRANIWRADIRAYSKKICIGRFTKESDAAEAYNKAALRYHGEFARVNIIISKPSRSR